MIGGKRKTIGVFINKTDDYFDNIVFRVIQEHGRKLNVDLLFFFTVGYHGSSNHYDTQEAGMFRFAPVEQLDGILVVPGSYEMADSYSTLMDMLRSRAKCPIVMIRSRHDEYDCVYTDESIALKPLIRHLIEDHNLTRIAFLAGYEEHRESNLRLQCYYDEMAAHGLKLPERAVFYGSMWYTGNDKAYEYFFADPATAPQAVICANDYMAHGLSGVLKEHGYRVPEDVIVTGFDNIESASFSMQLTTVGQDYATMVREALNQVVRRMDQPSGDPTAPCQIGLPGTLVLGESCGCNRQSPETVRNISINNSRHISAISQREISQTYLAIELNACDSLMDMHDVLLQKSADIPTQRDFYLCLFGDSGSNGEPQYYEEISDKAFLAIAMKDRTDLGMPMILFDRNQVLPSIAERADEPQAFFIILLHQGNSTYGYSAMQFVQDETPTIFYHHWNVIISNALRNMHMQMDLRRLYEERRLSSITDPLTHLYNRRGLEESVVPFWNRFCRENENICLIYMDLDNLKEINDNLGHAAGDKAICDFSDLLRKLSPAGATIARMGGDEFLCFIPDVTHQTGHLLVNRVNSALDEMNGDKPFPLACSFGVYSVRLRDGISLESCIIASDEQMYKNKVSRKSGRNR